MSTLFFFIQPCADARAVAARDRRSGAGVRCDAHRRGQHCRRRRRQRLCELRGRFLHAALRDHLRQRQCVHEHPFRAGIYRRAAARQVTPAQFEQMAVVSN